MAHYIHVYREPKIVYILEIIPPNYRLLESCGHSYAVSEALRPYAEHYFKSIDEALENLLSKLSE